MKLSLFSAGAAFSLLASVAAIAPDTQFLHLGKLIMPFDPEDEFPGAIAEFSVSAAAVSNITGNAFFTQWLDHDDHSKGTFQQKFWWNAQYWAGPGSPVRILFKS
jgi:hypothetical protein